MTDDRDREIEGLRAALARLEAHREDLGPEDYDRALAAIREQLAELGIGNESEGPPEDGFAR